MNKSEMTPKDQNLIVRANRLNCQDWDIAFDLMEQADTDEAKKRLRQIGIHLHHREEAMCGCL